jgi:hypothetical protein
MINYIAWKTLFAEDKECMNCHMFEIGRIQSKVKEQKIKRGEFLVQHARPVCVIKWSNKKTSSVIYISQG